MKEHLHPVRKVEVARAREALKQAGEIIASVAKGKSMRESARIWLAGLPYVLEGLPQTYEVNDLVQYKEEDGSWTDGVIVATVTCHERYVVTKGDDREAREHPLWMIGVESIRRRGEESAAPSASA